MHSYYKYDEKDIIKSHISFLYKVVDKVCEYPAIPDTMDEASVLNLCVDKKVTWDDDRSPDQEIQTEPIRGRPERESLLGNEKTKRRRYRFWKNSRPAWSLGGVPWIWRRRYPGKLLHQRGRSDALGPVLMYPIKKERVDLMEIADPILPRGRDVGLMSQLLSRSNGGPKVMSENATMASSNGNGRIGGKTCHNEGVTLC